MIGRYDLIELLNKYGINGERLIGNNSNVLDYGIYKEIEEIVKFLLSKGFTPNMIEKCPSIIYWTSSKAVIDNYNWLVNETEINFNDISGCLHILGSNLDEMKKIYNYVLDKYGIDAIKNCLSILKGDYLNIVSLTDTLEATIGLDIVKADDGGTLLVETTSSELRKILTIPEFQYNKNTGEYNRDLLTASTFQRTYEEIQEIFNLPYWKDDKYRHLLTSSIFHRKSKQIKEILELGYNDEKGNKKSYWEEDKYHSLLAPNIWCKTATQIEEVLRLPYWEEEKYKLLLTSTIWNKDAMQIEEVLSLPYWEEEKNYSLLKPNIWRKTATQIEKILSLSCWKEKKYNSLLTSTVWQKDVEEIEKILTLPYWKEKKYESLLTSVVWKKEAKQIEEILVLPYWKEEKYKPLLKSSMWLKNADQIVRHIEFCESDEELREFSNNPTLIYYVSYNELVSKTNYLRINNLPVIANGKPNTIYGMRNKDMQKKFGISKKELIRDYLNIDVSRGKKAV